MFSQYVVVRRVARQVHQTRAHLPCHAYQNVRVISFTATRSVTAAPAPKTTPPSPPPSQSSPQRRQSWLTTKVKSSPFLFSIFLYLARALGYGSPQQFANRRALHLYNTLCATRADQESAFWREACSLPPTFQSWFTITNLHVWLLTVRLRSLPAPHGKQHIQGLIDHFFQDVEERMRAVLQPGILPPRPSSLVSPNSPSSAEDSSYPSPYLLSSFYTPPSPLAPQSSFPSHKAYKEAVKLQARSRAPERLITRQMKILKEQWAGLGMSLDLGLVRGDAEMAAAVWRNMLGARGARGIGLSQEGDESGYRRAVNLVGGLVEDVSKVDVDKEELKDDNSGVHDFAASESDRYITYPELMVTLVSYIRRESLRLERINDSVIMGPRRVGREGECVQNLRWGDINGAVRR
ncbi:hypothetical protein AZE42_05088 [Rhizopogon vesiculosus]|uniref:Ubiquinol-cytochrome c chaperone domain-containing protein n=1 Tax=Rhizopogon vesiculosus TaxID=180088 RepID=A0A1J8R5V3_9AGAM|nr:hypothetical protein AZE42_05088 [Rhizopogon vesiculosus]